MDDARRFFRYIIPGLTFIIEISLYFALSDFCQFLSIMKQLMDKDHGLGVAATLFITSGGIGFLLGILYHFLYWLPCIRVSMVDHQPLIQNMINNRWLRVVRHDNNTVVQPWDISQSGAWRILTAYWHSRRGYARIKNANERVDSLGNTMHGLGTACVGSVLAFLIWIFVYLFFLCCSIKFFLIIVVPIIISMVHFMNYKGIVQDFNSVINIIVAEQIEREASSSSKPIVIYVSKNDLSEKYSLLNKCLSVCKRMF